MEASPPSTPQAEPSEQEADQAVLPALDEDHDEEVLPTAAAALAADEAHPVGSELGTSVVSGGEEGEEEVASLYGSLVGGAEAAAAAAAAASEPRSLAQEGPSEGAGPAVWDEAECSGSGGVAAAQAAAVGAAAAAGGQRWLAPAEAEAGGGPDSDAQALAQLRRHAKHVFVFSSAGKPVFSLHGDENELAGLMATAQAIMSVVQSSGQQLKHLRAGRHVIAFLDRSPLYLVGFSALGEPPAVLRMQLSLVHGQLVSLLTASALGSLFRRSPGYDLRKLLGGTEGMLRTLVASFSSSPAAALGAFPSLPLAPPVRSMVAGALATAVRDSRSLFGLVVGGPHVVALCSPPATPLQTWDALLLLNFLHGCPAFLEAEAFTPFCLPHYNPAANLHAYVCYLHAPTRVALVLLCGSPPDFQALSGARRSMQRGLEAAGTLQALQAAVASVSGGGESGGAGSSSGGAGGGSRGDSEMRSSSSSSSTGGGGGPLSIPAALPKQVGGGSIGTTPLLHFAYRLSSKQQFVMSPFSEPLDTPVLQQAVVVAYGQLRAAMFEGAAAGGGPLQRLRYEARTRFVLFASASTETELYLTLDPLADKAAAAALAERLAAWLRARHDDLFL